MSPCRSKQQLTNVHSPASDIASYEVRVHALKIGRRKNAPRQNAVAEAGSETINLILQFLQHVYFRSMRHMTIGPRHVFARWSPGVIEETGLGQQNERTVGVLSHAYCLFRRGNLFEASAEMHGRCPQAIGSFPGNGCAQRVIYFEDAGAVTELLQTLLVAVR